MEVSVIHLFNPLITFILAVVFLAAWIKLRSQKYILALSAAYSFVTLGFISNTVLFHYKQFENLTLQHYFFGLGAAFLAASINLRAQLAPKVKSYLFIIIFSGLVSYFILSNGGKMSIFAAISHLSISAIFAMGAMQSRRHRTNLAFESVLFWTFVFSAVLFYLRTLTHLSPPSMGLNPQASDLAFFTFIIFDALLSLILAITFLIVCMKDLIKEMRSELQTDSLSGLMMREKFERDVKQALIKAQQSNIPISLVISDIDHFKNINDSYGHQVGDMVIARMGQTLLDCLPDGDLAGRIGGEEFCFLIHGDYERVISIVENIRFAFYNQYYEGIPRSQKISSSLGITDGRSGDKYESMFQRADTALYQAKNSGRDCMICDTNEKQDNEKQDRDFVSMRMAS